MRKSVEKFSYLLIGLGLLALGIGWAYFPERTWVSFLVNSVYFVTLSLSCVFFLALHYVTGARWSEVIKRVPEAISSYLPYASIPMIALVFGLHSLYHWSHHDAVAHDPILLAKTPYLNATFFVIRMLAILAVWCFFAWAIRSNSLKFESRGSYKYHKRNIVLSVLFFFCFAITLSISSFDWIMSVDPHWFSTIFGIYNFSGMFLNGLVAITLLIILLKERNHLKEVNENHLHDLGKYIMAFSAFWAYIWYSQFVLIWYGNIPEETIYYLHRLKNDWDWLFYFNVAINFVIPFFILLPRSAKRSAPLLKRVCILLLVGRWLDLYLMTGPDVLGKDASIGVPEILVAFGFAGLFILVVSKKIFSQPLVPKNSPFIEESLHHHQ